MKRLMIISLSILFTLFTSIAVFADPISSYTDLVNYSREIVNENALQLNVGEYSITTPLDITEAEYKNLIIDNASTKLIVDGSGMSETLFTLNSLTIGASGGTLEAIGGKGIIYDTLELNLYVNTFIQDGGSIMTKGGDKDAGAGMYVETFTQNGGSIIATGGSGKYSLGFGVDDFIQNDGSIIAKGGNGTYSEGFETVYTFTQNGGSIIAIGGDKTHTVGFGGGTFTQNKGSIEAKGGKGLDSEGFWADAFTQNGGSIITTGGDGENAVGFRVDLFIQNGGSIIATGGNGEKAYGIYAGEIINIQDTLTIKPGGNAAAIYIQNHISFPLEPIPTPLTFGSESKLIVEVDLSLEEENQMGQIVVEKGNVLIEERASLIPIIKNINKVKLNEPIIMAFITNLDGSIENEFDYSILETLTFKVEAEKTENNDAYNLILTRKATPLTFLESNVVPNTVSLIEALWNAKDLSELLGEYRDKFDYFYEEDELLDYAYDLRSYLVPYEATRFASFIATQTNATRSLFNLHNDNSVWAMPIAGIGTKKATSTEFEDAKSLFFGIEVGASYLLDKFIVGAELHYISGSMKGDSNETRSNMFGGMVSGEYVLNVNEIINPLIEVHAGYSYVSLNHTRKSMEDKWINSKPTAGAIYAGFSLSNPFQVSIVNIIPQIGLEYTNVNMKKYEEENGTGLGLIVNPESYNSLRGNIGAKASMNITELIGVKVRATYAYEFLDTQTKLNNQFIESEEVVFTTMGEQNSKHNGNIGLSVNFGVSEKIKIEASYDLNIEGKNLNHMFSVEVKYRF